MPALPLAPNVVRVRMLFGLGPAHSGGSRFFMQYSGGPPTGANCNAIAAAVGSEFGTHLAGQMVSQNNLATVVVEDIGSATGADGSASPAVAGTNPGNPLPIDTCALINHQIARRYRGGKPKIFLPVGSWSELASGDDTWSSAFTSGLLTAWEAFIAALIATTGLGVTLINIVNVSYYQSFEPAQNPITGRWRNIPKPRAGDAVVDQIISSSVYPYVSQQRRRRYTPAA